MTVLSVSDLALSFGERKILDNVTFAVNEGDRVGIIGVNGAGKTTLFRILTGELSPDRGAVYLAAERKLGLLGQNTGGLAHMGSEADFLQGDTLTSYAERAFSRLQEVEREMARREREISSGRLSEEELLRASARLAALRDEWAENGGAEYRARTRSMLLGMGFAEDRLDSPAVSLSESIFSSGVARMSRLSMVVWRE